MDNAKNIPCDLLLYPRSKKYDENIRQFQGCPTIAVTNGGRIFSGWYSGGTCEPHMENYNLLVYSDDDGKSWSEPVLIIPSSIEKFIHALDIQLWISPLGHLYVFWVQNNTRLSDGKEYVHTDTMPIVEVDGYIFDDFEHSEWVTVCENPDAETLEFSEPRYLDKGFLRCKPLVLKNGRWINFNYDQLSEKYGYSISDDAGKSYVHYYGGKKIATPFDESMAYEKKDGTIRMFARTKEGCGKLAESISTDGGITWSDGKMTKINNPNTRFFVSRTPTGRIIMVYNDDTIIRKCMTVALSEDDGETWKYKRCIDARENLSYPDADFYNGNIYLTYDRERCGAKEILFVKFTEEDILNPEYEFEIEIISKP